MQGRQLLVICGGALGGRVGVSVAVPGTGASVGEPTRGHSARAEWLEWWKGWLAERRLPPPECLGVRDLRRG